MGKVCTSVSEDLHKQPTAALGTPLRPGFLKLSLLRPVGFPFSTEKKPQTAGLAVALSLSRHRQVWLLNNLVGCSWWRLTLRFLLAGVEPAGLLLLQPVRHTSQLMAHTEAFRTPKAWRVVLRLARVK